MISYYRDLRADRLVHSTANNNSKLTWVVLLFSWVCAVIVAIIHILIKKNKYKLEDHFILSAYIASLVVWILWTLTLTYGLGQPFTVLNDRDISNTQLCLFLSYVFLNIPIALSKISVLMLFENVFGHIQRVQRMAWGTIVLVTIWCIASSVGISINCSPATLLPNAGVEHCISSKIGLTVIAALEWLIELITMILPVYGFCFTMKPWKHIKTHFWIPLLISLNIFFSVMHLRSYSTFMDERQPPTHIVSTFDWAIGLLTYNLISATLPSLKKFTKPFDSKGLIVPEEGLNMQVKAAEEVKSHQTVSSTGCPSITSHESQQQLI